MKIWKSFFIPLVAILLMVVPVAAQTDDGVSDPVITSTVSGQIVNETAGIEISGNMETMLHVWDQEFNEKFMLHGESEPDGSFRFDDVALEPDLYFGVMVNYQDVTYFSGSKEVPAGETELNAEVSIFESTTDTSQIEIDTLHVFFNTAQGGLQVMEVYSLSNLGDQTVKEVFTLDDGSTATLRFPLPEEAASINFEGNTGGRYMTTPDGFADAQPLQPGVGAGQVMVSYVMPYTNELTYSKTVEFPTAGINFLLATDIGLSLEGSGLIEGGRRKMNDSAEIDIFSLEAIEPGDTVQVELSGTLLTSAADATSEMKTEPAAVNASATNIALGGIVLGLALIVVGIWWYRRPLTEEEIDETYPPTFDEVVLEIAHLDEAHERQDIDDEAYQLQRTVLREQARVILVQAGD